MVDSLEDIIVSFSARHGTSPAISQALLERCNYDQDLAALVWAAPLKQEEIDVLKRAKDLTIAAGQTNAVLHWGSTVYYPDL